MNTHCLDNLIFRKTLTYFPDIIADTTLYHTYREYYMSAYNGCIRNTAKESPQSYFAGLVLLCAINDICGVNAHFFKAYRTVCLRPIDVYCAKQAFEQIISDDIVRENRSKCSSISDDLHTFSILPEIGYYKSRPVYSLLSELRQLQDNIDDNRCVLKDYELFRSIGITDFGNVNFGDLIHLCEENKNAFLDGVMIRLIAHSGDKAGYLTGNDNYCKRCIDSFAKATFNYCNRVNEAKSQLLLDNYFAIKRLSRKIEQTFYSFDADSGMLHYYQ